MHQKTPLGLHLWQRIADLGVSSIFGVPGDMNLELLDYIDEVKGLSWVGTANELGAAYAADGYCRVKQCPGVIVTTMGVGELSAINGVAGAFTEQVKLIHIVGTTATSAQKKNLMIHHCLGPSPDHRVYDKISRSVRTTHCWLDDISTAQTEIDRVLDACLFLSLPVYIFVPMDFVHQPLPPRESSTPPALSRPLASDTSLVLHYALSAIYTAKRPVVIVDALVARHGASNKLRHLLDVLKFPTFCTPMGKGIVNEDKGYFYGVYNGRVSHPGVVEVVESSDLLLDFGPLHSDSNTGGHSRAIRTETTIASMPFGVVMRGRLFTEVELGEFLSLLIERIDRSKIPAVPQPRMPNLEAVSDGSEIISQSWIWRRIGDFLKPKDIVIVESGTAQFGFSDVNFPPDLLYITQIYYGSIGYATPACLGAAVARRDQNDSPNGRVILVVGDGSLQLTAQEVGTMVKLGLDNILILVLNNNGYTIERAIHGPTKGYNDIAAWNWQLMLSFFGHKNGAESSRVARTKAELERILGSIEYVSPRSLQLLEIHMAKMDVPWRLRAQISIIEARMKRGLRENGDLSGE
ncbi:putative benzoate 4-monooxygenase cytochrome p450 [Neofusicoccum parvum]|nr:putative benzoate 4-monooxygenase cytochrome p450 [Neofusicoccum parvum]